MSSADLGLLSVGAREGGMEGEYLSEKVLVTPGVQVALVWCGVVWCGVFDFDLVLRRE